VSDTHEPLYAASLEIGDTRVVVVAFDCCDAVEIQVGPIDDIQFVPSMRLRLDPCHADVLGQCLLEASDVLPHEQDGAE
jgi:hypothetical protein